MSEALTNPTFLSPNSFRFSVTKLPDVEFYYQEVSLPSVELGTPEQTSPLIDIPLIGEKLIFGTLPVKFIIDQYLINYKSIFNWLVSLAPDIDKNQFGTFDPKPVGSNKEYSDGILQILDSQNIPATTVQFIDLFPVSISGFSVESTNQGVEYLVSTVIFKYSYFKFIS